MKIPSESDLLQIQKFSPDLQGVFKLSDLQIILKSENLPTLYNRINRLVKAGVLKRFCKGVFTTENYSSEVLSSAINSDAYLSIGTVLAKEGLIGTVPEKRIMAVKPGRNRRYRRDDLVIDHFGTSRKQYFGFSIVNGVKYADCEKAYIDTLYYYMKGRRFSFNPASDVDVTRLDRRKVEKYLKQYKNSRFVKFCKGLLRG
ncbi:MAG: hypothetical protein A2268_08230 [Candidatus Raymondbacteria bacterium RifOxyA12_full_50_37]|nr:MAG: hypothetical protein A2268_08230 [Candidatus Raymondbacteria bacterium RifOxyA12_full_50_37]OGJ93490.1 MAG: hypothetical protein A2248_08940 [Candidatus Raymondbacteria bacterium RIFOXYA2_FULL_49_16]OGK00243.1 MAG: hypothetical protein A2487_14390 [Candidatus Raymondbacteria bacterium RifOxyC12_full_50_8]OGP45609.1 MAG: hypothetical protein A2324_04540 [Candidatus Raymondbacteria bacterium RIFOXYB2_FULL_49_35]